MMLGLEKYIYDNTLSFITFVLLTAYFIINIIYIYISIFIEKVLNPR